MSVSKVIWDSLSLSTNLPIDFLKLHSIPTPSSNLSLNSLLQPSWEGSWTGVVLQAVNRPAMFQLCVTVSSNSSTLTEVEMEIPHSKNLSSIFHKSYTSLEIAGSSLILLSLFYTSLSVSPVCFWQPDFMRAPGSPSNT